MRKSRLAPLFAAMFILLASAPALAAGAATPDSVLQARFAKVNQLFAKKKDRLSPADRATAEDLLAMTAQLAGKKSFKQADALIDELTGMLKATPAKAAKKAAKQAKPKAAAEPADEPADEPAVPARGGVGATQFTLEDAFRPAGSPSARAGGDDDDGPPPAAPPKAKAFDIKNLDEVDRNRLRIIEGLIPQVESVFKRHPNPETADALKNARRFSYYLKKKAVGYPAEPKTEDELDYFMKAKLQKVHYIDKK